MKRFMNFAAMIVAVTVGIVAVPRAASAAAPTMAGPVGLSILEIKMTGDEFVVLQNNTAAAISNLSSYWLTAYNNVNALATGVSSSSQQLPTASLLPGQTLLLSAEPMQTCGASVAGKLSLSLSDSGGFVQVSQSALAAAGSVQQTPGDAVSWSSGANGKIQTVPSSSKDSRAVYYRYFNGNSFVWQQASLDQNDFCQLRVLVVGGLGSSSAVTPLTLAATSPPATILETEAAADADQPAVQLPAADIGLDAPQLSELLPNPRGAGNDTTDEFIELYNPNAQPFDLTGFTLLTGLTTTHSYVFPAGTVLPATGFQAFYSEETKLSLSNTASQVTLLDPFGNVLSTAEPYNKAKDGLSWSSAKGKWYWTTQATPGASNVIEQPAAKQAAQAKKKKPTFKAAGVVGAKTTKLAAGPESSGFEEGRQGTTIHFGTLALVAAGALLYGAYEYRRDIANRLSQFRSKLGARRTAWPPLKRRRSD